MAKTKETKKDFQETLDELNKQFGKGTVIHSNEKLVETYDVIPTGSINIDYLALGVGGFAKSKIYELRGWQGSNKTTICGHLVASVQKTGGRVICIDSEHAWDLKYLSQLGVDINDLYISQPDYGEQGFEIAIALLNTGEVDLIVIDSDSALQPKSVMEGEIGQSAIGKKAKLNSDFYPKLKVAVGKSNTCVVVVSQYRDKVGVMFGDPRTTQGGHALEFYSDVIVDLTKSLRKEGDETSGTITTFKTLKNKIYTPFKSYKFPTIFGYGIDKVQETLDLADDYEIIKKWGEKVTYNEEKYNLVDFIAMLSDNEGFLEEIRNKIIEKIKS
jgi:recombination protein RecA